MNSTSKALFDLVASDLMTHELILLPANTQLRDAARILVQNRTSGAPVVDEGGRCVGVLSAGDFLRIAAKRDPAPAHTPRPRSCGFQVDCRQSNGEVVTLCTLPPGSCPLQGGESNHGGKGMLVCREPHTVLSDWQIVEMDELPADDVRQYMTPDPVTVGADVGICTLAQMMIDAQVHRIIVVDADSKPVGIVSSTDLISALASANRKP